MFICTGWITVPSPISVRSSQIQTYPRTRRALLHLLRLQYRCHGHPQRSSSSTCLVPFSPAILRFIILHLRNLSMCNHAGLSGESSAPGPFSVPISETSHGCVPLCLDFPGSVMTSGMVNYAVRPCRRVRQRQTLPAKDHRAFTETRTSIHPLARSNPAKQSCG